jgi:hypothetical protein
MNEARFAPERIAAALNAGDVAVVIIGGLAVAAAASTSAFSFTWHQRLVHRESDVAWVDAAGEVHVEREDTSTRLR